MPLCKRAVSPVHVSIRRLPATVTRDELECVANGTLANLVRQLSSLSRHAEHLFGELYHEAIKLDHKTNTLATRIDRLTGKVTQLDSNDEEGEEREGVKGQCNGKTFDSDAARSAFAQAVQEQHSDRPAHARQTNTADRPQRVSRQLRSSARSRQTQSVPVRALY